MRKWFNILSSFWCRSSVFRPLLSHHWKFLYFSAILTFPVDLWRHERAFSTKRHLRCMFLKQTSQPKSIMFFFHNALPSTEALIPKQHFQSLCISNCVENNPFCSDKVTTNKCESEIIQNSLSPLLQTPKEYEREYSRELQQKGVEASKFHGFAYDGIWVIAKTFTRVMELLRRKQQQNTYHNFTVDDREVGKLVLDVMNETNFFGVTVSYGADCFLFFLNVIIQ